MLFGSVEGGINFVNPKGAESKFISELLEALNI